MSHTVIRRTEMVGASLNLGGQPLDLTEYSTTGLMALAVGPRGFGKTNSGLLMAEQLSEQGWVSILIVIRNTPNNLTENFLVFAKIMRERKNALWNMAFELFTLKMHWLNPSTQKLLICHAY